MADNVEINEQCYLIDNMTYIASQKGNPTTSMTGQNRGSLNAPEPPYDSAQEAYLHILSLHPDQSNYDFLNKINVPVERSPLLENLPREFMSSLQPYFKLYKVYYEDEKDTEGTKVLMPFNNFQDHSF